MDKYNEKKTHVFFATPFQFKKDSKLEQMLNKNYLRPKKAYTIEEIYESLMLYFLENYEYDYTCQDNVICSPETKSYLNITAINKSQFLSIILSNLEDNKDIINLKRQSIAKTNDLSELNSFLDQSWITGNSTHWYRTSDDLRELVFPASSNHKYGGAKVYRKQEIFSRVHEYIKRNKEDIVDERNPKMLIVKNHPLGKLFEVQTIYIKELPSLIKRHIFKI